MFWPYYRIAMRALRPVAGLVLARRVRAGKEDAVRLAERWGRAAQPRPPGTVIWFHGASVGESLSLLPLAERLLATRPTASVLVTTGTVTSARLMADRLPLGRGVHQYLPLDHPTAVRRFLDHWRPNLAVWVESELWPNLVLETRRRGIRMALLNARLSDRSLRGWQRVPRHLSSLLKSFDLVLAQDERQAERLRIAGAPAADTVGDLKAAITLPAVSTPALADAQKAIGLRRVWLAASTHPGEEEVVAETHRHLRSRFPDLLTLLAPRHPARAEGVAQMLERRGLNVVRRSQGAIPGAATDVWLVDTLGELALFYTLAEIVLVAGSLGPPGSVGGHNPMEAASLGIPILHGLDTTNCAAATEGLDREGAAIAVPDAAALRMTLRDLLADPDRLLVMGTAALSVAAAQRRVLDETVRRLETLLPDPLATGAA